MFIWNVMSASPTPYMFGAVSECERGDLTVKAISGKTLSRQNRLKQKLPLSSNSFK